MPVCRIISAQMGSDDELADGRTQINHFKAYTHGGILKNRSIHPLMYSSISDTGDRIWINSNWVPTWRRIRIEKKKIHDRVGDGWVVDCRRDGASKGCWWWSDDGQLFALWRVYLLSVLLLSQKQYHHRRKAKKLAQSECELMSGVE